MYALGQVNMASSTSILFYCLIACICLSLAKADDGRKAYIVYMGSLPSGVEYSPSSHHLSILQSVSPGNSIIRSYTNSFNGFVARLTGAEKERLARLQDVVSVFPDRKLKLQTTRSWDFTGLPLNVKRKKTVESDIIIGVIDTGIWPESESFNDDGFGPIPKKWKGSCPPSFPCNKKLIGARDLRPVRGNESDPRDYVGHGTHTASTAAGSIVDGVNFFGVANGSARGGVPSSRIAAYKVCIREGCLESAILAGFDVAIKDGVDILSVSLGSRFGASEFYEDGIAIGGFHAFEKGILTVQAAGNNGGIASPAPWLFTVAASTIDRRIVSNTVLGNGKTLIGNAINIDKLGEEYSLISGEDANSSSCSPAQASSCFPGCLDSKLVRGKIVICNDDHGVDIAKEAGAIATIFPSAPSNVSYVYSLPASGVSTLDYARELIPYANNSKTSAKATIRPTETLFDSGAPAVASFSSRGPNSIAQDVLKPDITAPGVDILAAFSPEAPFTRYLDDKRSVNFSFISGTSMACPHVTGASAYIKSFRPTWSPSAVKSALMTTARAMSRAKNPEAEFAYGAGHIDPVKALNPGLVYETNTDDYVNFFCKLGYNASTIERITRRATPACPKGSKKTSPPVDVNSPTLSAQVNLTKPFSIVFQRTVTNVGGAKSTYKANVSSSPKIRVNVEPSILSFKSLNEKLSFNVTVTGSGGIKVDFRSMEIASLEWFDGSHRVRSPIVVYQVDTFRLPAELPDEV